MKFQRLCKPLLTRSFFLFGARGTGKSTLVKDLLFNKQPLLIDLLDLEEEERYATSPRLLLDQVLAQKPEWVIIDEIQKIPKLLNLVHKIIEDPGLPTKFALTGSSARKLKQGGANLLAGRAFLNNLYPLTSWEIFDDNREVDIDHILTYGTLPELYNFASHEEKSAFLRTYAQTYLKEEVWDEHLIRKIEPFRRFLPIAGGMNGEIINYAKLSREAGVTDKTIKTYFQILEDTLLGFYIEPYAKSLRKKQISSPKFYFFDTGVKKALSRSLKQVEVPGTYSYGKAFEHWLITEIHQLCDYNDEDAELSFFKSHDGREIDLIIERYGQPTCLLELKSTRQVSKDDTNHLAALKKDFPGSKQFILSQDPKPQLIAGIDCLPWWLGLKEILS